MQLKQKSYPFEYVLAAWFFLQILPFYTLPRLATFITFLILMATKYYLETFRFNYAVFFIVQAFVLFSTSFGWRFAAVLATIFVIRIFPVYEYPATTGRHRVGYKSLEYSEDLDMAIFYPTSEHDPARNQVFDNYAKVSARNYYGFKLIVTRYLPVILPKFLVDLAHTFYKRVYLNVTADAEIVRQDSEHKFPVILFSHGLGSYKHLYSIYFREWASHGFIVFSADHDEEIFKRWKKYEEFVDVRRPQLEVRTQTIRNLLDYIHNENNIRKLFNTNIKIDHDKVFLAGHSFGSATSASLATTDKRVTGGLVLLDPWMDPCSETVFTTAIRKPILIVRSNQFDGMEQIKENVTRFLHVNNQTTFSGYFQDTTHNDVTDFILTKPKNLEHALGCIGETDKEYRERKLLLHVSLVNLFLKLVCEEKDKPRSNVNLVEELKRRLLSLLQAYGRDEDFYFDV